VETVRCWKPFSGDFKIHGNPVKRVGGALKDAGKDTAKFAYKAGKNITAFQLSLYSLGTIQPKWSGTKTASTFGKYTGFAAAAVGGGYALGPYLPTFFGGAPVAAPAAVFETSEAGLFALETGALPATSEAGLFALEAGALPAAIETSEAGLFALEAGALSAAPPSVIPPAALSGSIDMPFGAAYEGAAASIPAAAGGSSTLLPAAVTGAASAAASKLLTKAVDSVINPLIERITGQPSEAGGGGGSGGGAGGYPFGPTSSSASMNATQLYVIAAALGALLIVAMKKSRG